MRILAGVSASRLQHGRFTFGRLALNGRSGLKDREEIVPLLHQLKRPTFFTLDHGFYRPTLLHQGYCLVFLDVGEDEAAEYIRRFLRHAVFRTRSQRMSKIVRLRHSSASYWQGKQRGERSLSW